MALQHAYAPTNVLTGLAATIFTWSTGSTTNRSYLNDSYLYALFVNAAAVGGCNVVVDLGAAQSVAAIAILNHNLRSIAPAGVVTVLIEHSPDGIAWTTAKAATTLTFSSGKRAARDKDHIFQFVAISKRYWRITLTWTGSFAFKLGELFFAVPTTLSRYTVLGTNNGEREAFRASAVDLDGSGGLRSHFIAGPIRRKRVNIADLTAAQREEFAELFRAGYGSANPFLFIPQYEATAIAAPNDNQDCLYGRIEVQEWGWDEPDFSLYSADSLSIRSEPREVGG